MDILLWTNTQTNKYIFKRLKCLLNLHGFVESPKVSKHLIRIREHHLQMVYTEVIYGRTTLVLMVAPSTSYSTYVYCDRRVYLKKNPAAHSADNIYFNSAMMDTGKALYHGEDIMSMWSNAMEAQIEAEIVSYFDSFDFNHFVHLTESRSDGVLSYAQAPGNDDALRFYTMAVNSIWNGDYQHSLALLKEAVSGYQKHYTNSISFGYDTDTQQLQNQNVAMELINTIEQNSDGCLQVALEKLRLVETDALKSSWGVILDELSNTKKLKRK